MITTSEGPWTRIGCIHAQGALTCISSRFLLNNQTWCIFWSANPLEYSDMCFQLFLQIYSSHVMWNILPERNNEQSIQDVQRKVPLRKTSPGCTLPCSNMSWSFQQSHFVQNPWGKWWYHLSPHLLPLCLHDNLQWEKHGFRQRYV